VTSDAPKDASVTRIVNVREFSAGDRAAAEENVRSAVRPQSNSEINRQIARHGPSWLGFCVQGQRLYVSNSNNVPLAFMKLVVSMWKEHVNLAD
jgi:hypothetical protein